MTLAARPLRTHQRQVFGLMAALAAGEATDITDVLAAVTPGGGKSLLPVIAGAHLIRAGIVERICWVVPRDSLRLQAEEAFADPYWRKALNHNLTVRAADNEPEPSRGLAGYVTTYQAIAAAPEFHLAEIRRRRTLLVVDELHHLPALSEYEPDVIPDPSGEDSSAWSRALLPMLESAALRLHLSGTLERADGRAILWLPYRAGAKARTREVQTDAAGWAVIGYSRSQAIAEKAVLPVTFGALDGEVSWLESGKTAAEQPRVGPHRLSGPYPVETTRPAIFTALRTGFALELLQQAFKATRELRAQRRAERGLVPGDGARGLGKLLVVAPDQKSARLYLDWIRGWMSPAQAEREVRLATSGERNAHESLAAFRLTAEPAILVTVAMAYEGLDAPEVAVVAALTHIRSRPWLEQMIARATRVDPHAGAYENQRALVFHPDDPLFAKFRQRIETEQGTSARRTKHKASGRNPFVAAGADRRAGAGGSRRDHALGEQRAGPALRIPAHAPEPSTSGASLLPPHPLPGWLRPTGRPQGLNHMGDWPGQQRQLIRCGLGR